MKKGCFIVFEGIDGSGKSEQFRRLTKKLIDNNFKVIQTREPTKNLETGKLINRVLHENETVSEETLALLFAADRVEHTKRKIQPSLESGFIVISDRYVYSSLAYQSKGMEKELGLDWVRSINKFAINPDIVVYLDITAETGQKRLFNGQIRIEDHTYFENIVQQEKIRSVYYDIFDFGKKTLFDFEDYPKKILEDFSLYRQGRTQILRVNGDLSIEEIEKIIFKQISTMLKNKNIKPKSKEPKTQSLTSFK